MKKHRCPPSILSLDPVTIVLYCHRRNLILCKSSAQSVLWNWLKIQLQFFSSLYNILCCVWFINIIWQITYIRKTGYLPINLMCVCNFDISVPTYLPTCSVWTSLKTGSTLWFIHIKGSTLATNILNLLMGFWLKPQTDRTFNIRSSGF